MLIRLQLEFQGAVAILQDLLLLPHCFELLLCGLVLLLNVRYQLLETHASDLRLQLLGKLAGCLILLTNQVEDDKMHKVDEVDGSLNNMFLGLGQALGRIPASLNQEEVVEAAIQFPVKLAEVLPPVSLGDAVLLPLVIRLTTRHATLALPATQLLKRRLAVDSPGRN